MAPSLSSLRVALGVFLVTCALEVLQLWHPPFLQPVRSSFIGQAILGDTFDWSDFPYYALGAFAGYFVIERVRSRRS